jgi:two-component system OmpR family sensor kinase
MNRLWVRISLTFVAIVVFVNLIPLTIGLSTGSFGFDADVQGLEHFRVEDGALPRVSGRFLAQGLWRFTIVVTAIGIAVGIISSRGLTSPLNKLAEAAKAIGSQDLSRRVEVRGSEEIRVVAQAFNEMAAALEKAETLRSNMLADVAHELRTPLSVIQGSLRAILDDVYELDKTEIARLYDQTRHLSRLVDDLRELAQAEANQLPLNVTTVDLITLTNETASIYAPIIEAEGLALRLELEDRVPTVQGDRARLAQCLQNLLNNAIHHTPRGGEITVELTYGAEQVQLRVRDTGRGIAAEHLPHILDRFYRADPARGRDTGGTGLGLAIVRAIVEAHGGKVTAASKGIGQGSTFTIQLPV